MPAVKPNEDQSTYVSRCVGDPGMGKEFPDNKQRVAVCYSLFKQHQKKHGKSSTEVTAADWDETRKEIDASGIIVHDSF